MSNVKLKRAGIVKARTDMKRQPGANALLKRAVRQPIRVEPRVIMHSSLDICPGMGAYFYAEV